MIKNFLVLVVFIILASCSTQKVAPTTSGKNPEPVVTEVEKPEIIVKESFVLKADEKYTKLYEIKPAANCVVNLPEFKIELEKLNWPKIKITGIEVYSKIAQAPSKILRTYYKKAFWGTSPVYAYTYLNHHEIYFNRRYWNRTMPSLVNTSVHELTHAVGYAHGKHDPIPWDVGKLAERLAGKCIGNI